MGSAVEEAVEASRRLHPDLWRKADRIAEIIAPGAFAEAYDGIDGEKITPTTRQQYQQAEARRKAWEILRYLGEAPEETDWSAIIEEAGWDRDPAPQEGEDDASDE